MPSIPRREGPLSACFLFPRRAGRGLCLWLVLGVGPLAAAETTVDLSRHFGAWDGCFVLRDPDQDSFLRFNPDRGRRRLSPCSTFKIPHSLIGLDLGILRGPDHLFRWDGTKRRRAVLNRDHDLRSALTHSVVWYYQALAPRIGEARMQAALDALAYGNRDLSGGLTRFWLSSSLKISAEEQVAFLTRLARGDLPVSRRAQAIVRDLLVVAEGDGCVLRGKTGSGFLADGTGLGWFVGYRTCGDRTQVFALNLQGEGAHGRRARALCREILAALPPAAPASAP